MPQKATRNGTTVSLPKYCNAEMLLLEFFAGQDVMIRPAHKSNTLQRTILTINMHVDILDELLNYINANI